MSEQSGFNVTIKKGQLVEVISYEKTRQFCGRESGYNKGDSFIVESVSDNQRGYGKILSDNNFNYVHEDDVKWVSVVKAGHRIDEPVMFANQQKTNTLSERVSESGITRTCVREAFEKSEIYRQWAIAGMPKDKQRLAFGVFEARQAEVDSLEKYKNSWKAVKRLSDKQLGTERSSHEKTKAYATKRVHEISVLSKRVLEQQKRIDELEALNLALTTDNMLLGSKQ